MVSTKVDVGILTIRDDEFRAVLRVFPEAADVVHGRDRDYTLRYADLATGGRYRVAVLRQIEQGHGEAQTAARDLIDDLAPRLVLVVGIAGGVPSDDVTLGDVIIATRIHDFTVEARRTGQEPTYAATGGGIAKKLAAKVANLAARDRDMGDWTVGLPALPIVRWTGAGQLYGPKQWRAELRKKLKHHYPRGSQARPPVYRAGDIASSDRLVEEPSLLFPWIITARKILAVEMESGGVFRAAQERCPMLAIRGISDIVGLKRTDAWTKFACASAAAFTRAFLRTCPVDPATERVSKRRAPTTVLRQMTPAESDKGHTIPLPATGPIEIDDVTLDSPTSAIPTTIPRQTNLAEAEADKKHTSPLLVANSGKFDRLALDRSISGVGRTANDFRPPLKVHLCWFDNPRVDPICAVVARELHEILYRPLQDDAVHRPGIEIPVEYGRSLPDLLDALEAGREPAADARLVIAILDAATATNHADKTTVRRAVGRWRGRAGEIFLPVVIGGGWQTELRGPEIAPVMLDRTGPGGRWTLGIQACMAAGRALPRSVATLRRPRVVMSYARADGTELTRRLAARIHEHTDLETWYDRSYVPTGEELAQQLERGAGDAVVLVVRTDRYSESSECVHELLAAKLSRTPIVTLLATVDGEIAAPAYGGNHRTMTWRDGRDLEVAARCVEAWLHAHHFRAAAVAALALAGLPADSEVLPWRPELLDLIGSSRTGRRLVIHPDPPLTDGEATVLRTAYPAVRIATPTTLLGRMLLAHDPQPPLTGTTLAFSLSVAEELPRLTEGRVGSGLTQDHVEEIVHAVVLATLRSGARVAYGGDLARDPRYSRLLAGLHRSYGGLGTRASAQLMQFFDPAESGGIGRDNIEFDPIGVPPPPGSERYPELRPVLWRLAMREVMSERCTGRILLGGRTRPSETRDDDGYRGPWPGLLEEAWRTLRRGRALYVVGGFRGAAGLIATTLISGEVPPLLTRAYHVGGPLAVRQANVDVARAALAVVGTAPEVLLEIAPGRYADIEDLAGMMLARWQRFVAGDGAAWPNGLDVDENLRLFRSTDRTEITYLVFEGLRRIGRRSDGELQVALYHGDIASVPRVDGYAITVTPGMPSVGAFAALEPHMGRARLGAATTAPAIAIESVATSDLSGSHVLIAQLALPPIGQPIEAAAIEGLAYEIAQRANSVGLESIACPLLGTTFGLSIARSVRAIVDGFRRGRGYYPAKLVFCEVDRGCYEQLRAVLAPEAVELRAGAVPPVLAHGPVLHVGVEVQPTGTLRVHVTLYVAATQTVAPLHEAMLAAERWDELRDRVRRFEDAVLVGRELWRDLLSEEMRAQLRRDVDWPVMILCDSMASSIPWELLSDDDGAPHRGGVVRRIALSGSFRSPVHQLERARLRVLVVADPRRDLGEATVEADEVCRALSGRADVIVKRLDGAQATIGAVVAELERGYHDVFHYAGHGLFDETNADRSGLVLADGSLVAAELPPTALQLVFLSACESGRVRDVLPAPAPRPMPRGGRSIAEAFLRSGVRSFVGTFYTVDDASARRFASSLHGKLAAGKTLGDAMCAARGVLYEHRNPDWGNFVLYGDDRLIL